MKAVTKGEMRACEHKAISQYGISGLVLMENAGLEVFRLIEKLLGSVVGKKVVILAGKGNNGGDGYVVARHLVNQGARVTVFLVGSKKEIVGDAAVNLNILEAMGVDLAEVNATCGQRIWDRLKLSVKISDCVVDALLGTGFKGEVTGDMAEVIDIVNTSGSLIVSVDIPSGVDADTGRTCGKAVEAAYTVTFALPKIGLLFYPGAFCAGELIIADITIPAAVLNDADIKQNAVTMEMVKKMLPRRSKDAHKGISGRALVVAGSRGLGGAAYMAATGALRAGAGLITLAAPEGLYEIMAAKLTEVMTKPLQETSDGTISIDSLPDIIAMAKKSQVMAIGPGLGRSADMANIMREVVRSAVCPLVIDADAINALAGQAEILRECVSLPVLTPHIKELSTISKISVDNLSANHLEAARRLAAEWGCVLVFKGARTVVAFPDGEAYINTTGNEGMASGGTGDVLTGIIAGFIAQGLSTCDAAVAGVYIHGLAGDIAAKSGVIGLTATDILAAVPAAIHAVCELP
jgi:NAD(P)H-hydrate epimerase